MVLLVQYTLIFASVLALVALGGCFSEHSGVINIGLEGIMVMGALGGVTGFLSGSGSTWLTSLHLSATLLICSIICLVLLPVSMRFSVQWMAEKEY